MILPPLHSFQNVHHSMDIFSSSPYLNRLPYVLHYSYVCICVHFLHFYSYQSASRIWTVNCIPTTNYMGKTDLPWKSIVINPVDKKAIICYWANGVLCLHHYNFRRKVTPMKNYTLWCTLQFEHHKHFTSNSSDASSSWVTPGKVSSK